MSQLKHTAKSQRHPGWCACVPFALMIVYLLGAFQSTSHHFVHGEPAELHSESNELDACHQSIYHNSNQECGHKLHLSTSEQCSLCHLVFHSESVLPENNFSLVDNEPMVVVPSFYSFFVDIDVSNLSARAPPLG